MREWLTVIIVLLIVAVILDGLRRMRQSRRSNLRMSSHLNQQAPAAIDDISDYGSELPSGGARLVKVREARDAAQPDDHIQQGEEYQRQGQRKPFHIPEQVSLNLDLKVPTLMESVADTDDIAHRQRSAEDIVGYDDDERIEPVFDSHDVGQNNVVQNNADESLDFGHRSSSQHLNREIETVRASNRSDPIGNDGEQSQREPELVLAINVMAPKGEQFSGEELLDVILSQGLRFGAMNIFHRHEQEQGEGEILYSMANIVVPGTFDLAKMRAFSTPGVSLFMTLPMDANGTEAFEDMLTTAKIIGARLNGELKDENRSVLTPQTITHYRGKLQEFARKQLSKAPV